MMTFLFVVQIIDLMFALLAVYLLARINAISVGPKRSLQKTLITGTVSSSWILYP